MPAFCQVLFSRNCHQVQLRLGKGLYKRVSSRRQDSLGTIVTSVFYAGVCLHFIQKALQWWEVVQAYQHICLDTNRYRLRNLRTKYDHT